MKYQPPAALRLDLPQADVTKIFLEQQQASLECGGGTQRAMVIGQYAGLALAVVGSLTMALLTQSSLLDERLSYLVALIPWMFSSDRLKQKCGVLMVDVMVTMQLLSDRSVREYVQSKIFPYAYNMLRRIVVIEAWRLAWTTLGKRALQVFQRQNDDWYYYLPGWMRTVVSYVEQTFRRGSQKLFQKTIEKTVEEGVGVVVGYIAKASPIP